MIPLPIRDENPTLRTPVVTITIILLCVVAWLAQLAYPVDTTLQRVLSPVDASVLDFGAIPAFVLHGLREGYVTMRGIGRVFVHQEVPPPWTILTSMFMHGGWLHIIGNMWFLWIFGDNVEDRMGRIRFVVFYLLCGTVAALVQMAAMPNSMTPIVGASGAIAGVLGGYIMLFPTARVQCLWILIIFITTITVPAWLLLGLWFLSQFYVPGDSGIAWQAHVGGFVTGFLLVRLFTAGVQSAAPRTRRAPVRWGGPMKW